MSDCKVTTLDALRALDSLDDYARMEVGIAATGAVRVLLDFIKQNTSTEELTDYRVQCEVKSLEWCATPQKT